MNIIGKYMTEAKMKLSKKTVKDLIQKKKSGKYEINGNTVDVSVVDDTIILTYPSDMVDFTYALAQASDDLGYDYNQIGLGNKKKTKFIIDLS
jgi:inorganic pyrophosphatase/exopolyphosphatase